MKTVSEQMELARKAQAIVNDYTQEQIDEICLAIGWEVYEDENIAKLAKMAVEETGYGNVQSKIIKHKRKVGGVLHDIRGAKSVGLIERNEEKAILGICREHDAGLPGAKNHAPGLWNILIFLICVVYNTIM